MNRYQKFFKNLAAGAMAILLCALAVLPASAMSSLDPEPGIDVFGVFPEGRKSQLCMDSLALTYDIPELPADEFDESEILEAYSSTLRLDYTFSNPTDTEQTVKMMFAAGDLPSYAERSVTSAQRAALYTVELDGERITPELRHVWTSYPQGYRTGYNGYDPREYAGNLHDSYAGHALLSPDLPVTVYTYQPYSELDEDGYFYYDMTAPFEYDASRTLIFSDRNVSAREENGTPRLRVRVGEDSLVTLYVLGEDIGEVNWKLLDDGKRVEGSGVRVVDKKSITFGELAMREYDPDAGISEHDWYNAVLDMMDYCHMEDSCLLGYNKSTGSRESVELDVSSNLQCFLTYDVTLGAGESTVNSITLPVYPDVLDYYSPKAATFRYHFHGGFDWKTVGKYTVRINTRQKIMTDEENSVSINDYKKDRNGYTLPARSTPTRAYSVTLCKWKNPVIPSNFAFVFLLFITLGAPALGVFGGIELATVLALGVIVLIVNLVQWRRRKKQGEQVRSDDSHNDDDMT